MAGLAHKSPLSFGDLHSTTIERGAPVAPVRYFERRMFTDGTLIMPDGAHIPYWGFEDPINAPGIKSLPSPVIRMCEGETAQVRLEMRKPAVNGASAESSHTASGDALRVASFDSHIYQWQPRAAGSWLYQSHTSTAQDFEMGLFGLLIVDPEADSTGRRRVFKNGPSYDVERLWVLDDIDPAWHTPRNHNGCSFDGNKASAANSSGERTFDPKYFLVNGVVNTEALHHRDVAITAKRGEKLLIRLLNASFSLLKVSIEHFNGAIVSVDGTAIDTASSPWTSWIPVRPGAPLIMSTGSRHDLLIDLDPGKNPVVLGQAYKVVFEFLDLARRLPRNASAANALHTGRITTTITVVE